MSQTLISYQHPSYNTNMGGLNEQPRQPLTSKLEPLPSLDTNQTSQVYQLPIQPDPIQRASLPASDCVLGAVFIQRASLPNDYEVWSRINIVCSVLFSYLA